MKSLCAFASAGSVLLLLVWYLLLLFVSDMLRFRHFVPLSIYNLKPTVPILIRRYAASFNEKTHITQFLARIDSEKI